MAKTGFALMAGALGVVVALAGCGGGETAPDGAGSAGKTPATTQQTNGLPASVWLKAKPAGVQTLTKAKASAEAGERVAFEAQVGGRAKVYVPGRAIVLVADPALRDCGETEDDHCPTPWDYCCEDPAALKAGTAAIQFVDESGSPLHVSLEGMDEFKELNTMYVTGVVHDRDDEGTFTVNVDGVFIERAGG